MPAAGCCHNEQSNNHTASTITRQTKQSSVVKTPIDQREREREAGGGNNKKGGHRRPGRKAAPQPPLLDKNGLPDKFNAKHEPANFYINALEWQHCTAPLLCAHGREDRQRTPCPFWLPASRAPLFWHKLSNIVVNDNCFFAVKTCLFTINTEIYCPFVLTQIKQHKC